MGSNPTLSAILSYQILEYRDMGASSFAETSPIWRLRLRPAGMFSNVNEVVQQLHLALLHGYRFVIDWSASCYRDPTLDALSPDPWTYYFLPCFPDLDDPPIGLPLLPGGPPVACARENIITPREREGECDSLLPPRDRRRASELIDRFVRLNETAQAIVTAFERENLSGEVIGLHIRGPGRTDGGAAKLRSRYSLADGVPLDLYFEAANRELIRIPNARILVCSDSIRVIEAAVKRFGQRVITYPATRSEFGEMHARHPRNKGMIFPLRKLGMDVVVEAHLLAATRIFIHGNSNVANFVVCRNPSLPSICVYDSPHT